MSVTDGLPLTKAEAYEFAAYHRDVIDPDGHPFSLDRVSVRKILPGRGSASVWIAFETGNGHPGTPWFRTFYFDPERNTMWAVNVMQGSVREYCHPDLKSRIESPETEPVFRLDGSDEGVRLRTLVADNISHTGEMMMDPIDLHRICHMNKGDTITLGGGAFASREIQRIN